jgi:arylsulfatase A-like enzyme
MPNRPVIFLLCITIAILSGCGGSSTDSEQSVDDTPIATTPPEDDSTDDGSSDDDTTDDDTTDDDTTDGDNVLLQPNILLIISDDQGLDASAQYKLSNDLPNTPNIDALAEQGVTFDNMWATPACSTTRGTMLTGKYGINSGVTTVPAVLSDEHEVLQQYLKQHTESENYQSAVFGKWHLSGGMGNATHPNDVGIEHYAGNLGNLSNYYDWSLTVNGITEASQEYHSTKITDLTIDWLSQQTTPWFAWVAYSAPHSPFHLPPESLHTRDLADTNLRLTVTQEIMTLPPLKQWIRK